MTCLKELYSMPSKIIMASESNSIVSFELVNPYSSAKYLCTWLILEAFALLTPICNPHSSSKTLMRCKFIQAGESPNAVQ